MVLHISQLLKKLPLLFLAFGILAISLVVSFCFANQDYDLLQPKTSCNVYTSWREIQPGKSSRQNVVNILGQPKETGIKSFGNKLFLFYAYTVEEGVIADYAMDKIFFHLNGIVAWMEIVVGDRNGTYHRLADYTSELGYTLDTIYMNNNYDLLRKQIDVLGGPDQLYIWSDCGLALDILPYCSLLDNEDIECSFDVDDSSNSFRLRYPNPYNVGGEPPPNLNGVVLMKFFFPPTTYDGFADYYMDKIPFGLWDDYIKKLDWDP